jgi:hypothetical protein
MKGAGKSQVAIRPLSGITPEQARDARARAWSFVFACWNAKKGSGAAALDARKEDLNVSGESILHHGP